MQPSEKITPMHRRHDGRTPLSILSTDAREVNSESTAAEATVQRPAAATAVVAAALATVF